MLAPAPVAAISLSRASVTATPMALAGFLGSQFFRGLSARSIPGNLIVSYRELQSLQFQITAKKEGV